MAPETEKEQPEKWEGNHKSGVPDAVICPISNVSLDIIHETFPIVPGRPTQTSPMKWMLKKDPRNVLLQYEGGSDLFQMRQWAKDF